VLTYRDSVSALPKPGQAGARQRNVEIHLTGNMERFMWSIDGEKFSENPEPIRFERNERVRMTMDQRQHDDPPDAPARALLRVVNGHSGNHPVKHT
jgi:FtsP/CotA-like multicopper oxidase with cupredoxin domain